MTDQLTIDLIVANVRRILWATKTKRVFLSVAINNEDKQVDPSPELLEALSDETFEVLPFSACNVHYPNGVTLRDDISQSGVWVAIKDIRHLPSGSANVTTRFYATHLMNFEKTYTWECVADQWLQEGSTTVYF